ncbi:hypothetical protein TorRG33x02_031030 [Trema orientale]|uniref:Uncharacterized protein n=1 Tax=Trema orientale TaxID=63057 RepID=A0A2P5FT14_TREOI|nr:hypothetical protein TorRG33x02_031030 [Trema orientale]
MKTNTKGMVLNYLGFKAMTRSESLLGSPMFLTNNHTRDFLLIKKRVISRLEGWKGRLLSRAGRTTLVKTVIQSIPTDNMATFKLPNALCEDMNKHIRKFWWTGSFEKDRFLALT